MRKAEKCDEPPPDGTPDLSKLAGMLQTAETLKANGIYFINGPIATGSLLEIQQDLILKNHLGKNIWSDDAQIIINSPGGDAFETNALIDIIEHLHFDIRTVGLGLCASAGAYLLAAGTKGKRVCGPGTQIMVHGFSWGNDGRYPDLVAHRKIQDTLHQQEIDFWIKHSKYKNRKDVEKYLLAPQDKWLTAKEAVKHGIIDIISSKAFDE